MSWCTCTTNLPLEIHQYPFWKVTKNGASWDGGKSVLFSFPLPLPSFSVWNWPIINATLFVRWTVCCTYAGNLRTANLFQATLDQVDHQTGEILSRVIKMKSVRVVVSSTQKKKHLHSIMYFFRSFCLYVFFLLKSVPFHTWFYLQTSLPFASC